MKCPTNLRIAIDAVCAEIERLGYPTTPESTLYLERLHDAWAELLRADRLHAVAGRHVEVQAQ